MRGSDDRVGAITFEAYLPYASAPLSGNRAIEDQHPSLANQRPHGPNGITPYCLRSSSVGQSRAIASLPVYLVRRDVIKNKVDPAGFAFIHHAMFHLVIDLIDVANFKLIRATVDHKSHLGVSANRDVYPMPVVERGMFISVWDDKSAWLKSRSHCANYRTSDRVVVMQNLMHERNGLFSKQSPPLLLCHLDIRPSLTGGEY